MGCLSRMGLGLVGLALVAPPGACADSEPPDTPPSASSQPRLSLFHKPRVCARCLGAELQTKGVAVPPAPAFPKGARLSNEKCDRCGGPVAMWPTSEGKPGQSVLAHSSAMTPPSALALTEPGTAAAMGAYAGVMASAPGTAYSSYLPPTQPVINAVTPQPSVNLTYGEYGAAPASPASASTSASAPASAMANVRDAQAGPAGAEMAALQPTTGEGGASPPAASTAQGRGSGSAYTWVAPSPAPPPPPLASRPPLVPARSAGPAWASIPAGTAPLVVASTAPPPQATAPASGRGGLLARTRARSAPASDCGPCAASAAVVSNDTPGHATVGGGSGPGYAVIGGTVPMAEPTPIGVIQGRYAYQPQGAGPGGPGMAGPGMPAPGGRNGPGGNVRVAGSVDSEVLPSNFQPEPKDPMIPTRPHIITHLFGIDAIGRHSREKRERREREKHASISYQPEKPVVDNVPASMVYGK